MTDPFATGPSAIPAGAVPSAPVPGRSREDTLRAFIAGESVLNSRGRAWARNPDTEAAARRELAESDTARSRAAEEERAAEQATARRCPWCHGPRRAEGTRLHCLTPSCRTVGGVQAQPIPAGDLPQTIVVFYAPPKPR